MIVVVSTGFAHANKEKCLASVREQKGATFEHVYIEASEQPTPLGPLENFYNVADRLAPDVIVACLDGDDWLAHDRALLRVQTLYEENPKALVTYGQFERGVYPYGPIPGCSPYPKDEYRHDVWRASHLKTFRAGIFQRIKKEDLMYEGRFADFTCDLAVMFPILEMAGPARTVFNREPIYVYDETHAQTMARNKGEMQRAHAIEAHIRALPRYERIEDL